MIDGKLTRLQFEQQHNLYEATIHKLRARLAKADGDSALATKQSGQRISRLEKEVSVLCEPWDLY